MISTTGHDKLKSDFSVVFRLIARMGWGEYTFGHCSLKLDENRYLINESGISFDKVFSDNLVEINQNGDTIGNKKPASFFSQRIFHQLNPENKIVLHVHYAPSIALANAGKLHYHSHYEAMLGSVAFIKQPQSLFDKQKEFNFTKKQLQAKTFFCARHGVYVVGESVQEAFFRLYLACKASDVFCLGKNQNRFQAFELPFPHQQELHDFWRAMCECVIDGQGRYENRKAG